MRSDSAILITGGAGGIGSAATRLLVQKGHRVAVCDIDVAAAERLCGTLGDRAFPIAFDVRNPSEWQRALDVAESRFGRIDVVINNAGLIYTGWADDHPIAEIQHMVDVNFLGLVHGTRAAVQRMLRNDGGHLINVGSLAAYTTLPGQSIYCATKHAVRAFHHGYALEHRNSPVAFTLICPAAVDTPMLHKQINDDAAALSFADRVLDPEEIAQAMYRAVLNRPREIMIPAFKGGGLKFVCAFPSVMARILVSVEKKGRRGLAARRREAMNGDNAIPAPVPESE